MLRRLGEPHCHVCCLKYFFVMSSIFGMTPYKVECRSSEKLKVSKPLYSLSILTGACVTLLGVYHIGVLNEVYDDDRLFVVLTGYLVFLFNAASGIFTCLGKVDLNTVILMGYFRNFDAIRRHCKPSLYKSLTRKLYLTCFGYVSGYLSIIFCTFLVCFLTNAAFYFIPSLVLLQFYVFCLYIGLEAHIHLTILKLVDDTIKDLLNRQIGGEPKFLNVFAYEELNELHRIRIQLYLNSKRWSQYYSPTAAIVATNYFIGGVVFFSLLIDLFPYHLTDLGHEFISYFLIAVISLPTMLLVMGYLNRLENSGRDLEGYLFMYPITKLHLNLRCLIEEIILALDYCKPICKSSDIVVLSRKLVLSEIRIMVTYTITLLQYYNAYIKPRA